MEPALSDQPPSPPQHQGGRGSDKPGHCVFSSVGAADKNRSLDSTLSL